ncbi:hypothetical protein CCACVL1_24526 [Corchorus capsularis]|uniref:Uncharacterized protein n=1 Tax=Corchorus capsularis TaxID=210143 RepID=A0A1R3GPE4_COCAP|nr:hypothetical protein CCACVL1_24526 [Corchorus capsularis]
MADHILADRKAPKPTISLSTMAKKNLLLRSLYGSKKIGLSTALSAPHCHLKFTHSLLGFLQPGKCGNHFANSSKQRARDLLRKLQEVKRNEHTSLEAYLQEVKMISNELAVINQLVDDSDKLYWSLNGHDDKYESFVTAMHVRSPSPSFDEFTNLLSEYEKRQPC